MGFDSATYWEKRYRSGRKAGAGSYGLLAHMKAAFVNRFVEANAITSILDLGCGDGFQTSLLVGIPYLGVEISPTILAQLYKSCEDPPPRRFVLLDALAGEPRRDLGLSLDVVYTLVEDDVFAAHLRRLFLYARRCVIIYSSNKDIPYAGSHIRHRRFTDFVAAELPEWRLVAHVPNPYPLDARRLAETSFADFFVFAAAGEDAQVPIYAD